MAAQAVATAISTRTSSKIIANRWAMSMVVPMAVKAVLELGIPDILAKAEGGKPLSALEILAKLPTKTPPGPKSSSNLTRLMRPLVQEGVFSETLNNEKQPAYGLTEISNFCVKDHEWSVVSFSAVRANLHKYPLRDGIYHYGGSQNHGKLMSAAILFNRSVMLGLTRLHEAILDEDTVPFTAESGLAMFEYAKKNPEFRLLFDKAMTGLTLPVLKDLVDNLKQTGWLDGVKTFVDIGGSEGTVASYIVAHNPHIAGINFDLPGVLATTSELKGVRHVEGDFFKAVPTGDALFMKYIMHNYGDEDCIKILSNCFEALPKGGKVIIAEYMLTDSDNSPKANFTALLDVVMLGSLKGALERTEAQYHEILSAAGFSKISTFRSLTGMDLIQGIKD